MYWNPHTLQTFASDAATLERAHEIAYPFRWEKLQGNENLLWGTYKTGVAPFHTAVHLHQPRHTCNCPSRRRPCKHVLSLLLLYLNGAEGFQVWHDYPDWVEKWLSKPLRNQSDTPPQLPPQEKTLSQMLTGAQELKEWLLDIMRHGLAAALMRESRYWNAFAENMTNAKLGGIGKRIRRLSNAIKDENAHEKLLAVAAELYLLAEGLSQWEQLPPDWQQELLYQAGISFKKEDLLSQSGIKDEWLIAGQTELLEENLRVRRTWLIGQYSEKQALLLDFVWGNADFSEQWQVGSYIKAEVVFYPSTYQQRAVVKTFENARDDPSVQGYSNWESFAQHCAQAIAQQPWIGTFPVLIENAIPLWQQQQLFLIDNAGKMLPAIAVENKLWKIIAASGGQPAHFFCEWHNNALLPLTLFHGQRVICF